MNSPRRGLGRGLGSLIPARPATSPSDTLAQHPSSTSEREIVAGGELTGHPPAADQNGYGSVPASRPSADNGAGSDDSLASQHSGGPANADGAAYFAELPVGSIRANPQQPRSVFDEESLAELTASILEVGLLQPVVVRELTEGGYELVLGERRWRASQRAGLSQIPAIVRQTADHDLLRDALLENLHRADLNPLEEAAAYQQLLDDFDCTHEELAARLGRSRPQISNTLRLLRLPPAVQRRLAAGVLSAGHARALLAVEGAEDQEALAARVVAEGMSVRSLEEQIALGGRERPRRAERNAATSVTPELVEVADRLSERFDTRCKVALGRSKGKITVEFASLDDLQRILAVML